MLGKIATTFHVSTDELLGRQYNTELTNDLKQIKAMLDRLDSFEGESVTDHDRKILAEMMVLYLKNR